MNGGMIGKLVITFLIAYALGDINPAIILGKIKGIDIRKEGSGNAGMTNTIRVMGLGYGIAVFAVDVLKAFIAVKAGFAIAGSYGAMAGFAGVVIGHCFPAAFGFRGGKGVAASLGAALALNWQTALMSALAAGAGFGLTRKMSVGSLAAAASYPVFIWFFAHEYRYFAIVMALFLVFTHSANIKRLAKGEENTLTIGGADAAEKVRSEADKEKEEGSEG